MHYQNDKIEVSTNLLLIRAVVFSLFQVVEPCIINKYFVAEPKRLIYSLIYRNFKEPVRKLAEPGLKSTDLESPKSQILRSQLELIKRLEGLRSRCNTLAEWMYLRPAARRGRRWGRAGVSRGEGGGGEGSAGWCGAAGRPTGERF